MKVQKKREAGPLARTGTQHAGNSTRAKDSSDRQIGKLVVVRGELLPPAGRRTMAAVIVRRCPACGFAHLHRAGRLVAGELVRTGSCGTEYVIQVQAIPAQRRGA